MEAFYHLAVLDAACVRFFLPQICCEEYSQRRWSWVKKIASFSQHNFAWAFGLCELMSILIRVWCKSFKQYVSPNLPHTHTPSDGFLHWWWFHLTLDIGTAVHAKMIALRKYSRDLIPSHMHPMCTTYIRRCCMQCKLSCWIRRIYGSKPVNGMQIFQQLPYWKNIERLTLNVCEISNAYEFLVCFLCSRSHASRRFSLLFSFLHHFYRVLSFILGCDSIVGFGLCLRFNVSCVHRLNCIDLSI